MATSNTRSGRQPVTAHPTTRPDETSRVKHVDELSEAAFDRFLELLAEGPSGIDGYDDELGDGDVIVFTDYYRLSYT